VPNYPRITPYLFYEDAAAAIEWLVQAFGFRERLRMPDENGHVMHAELDLADGVIMLGEPTEYESPKQTGHSHCLVHVYVDDVDRHFERARDAGATVVEEPEDQPYGDRRYTVKDPEGQQWTFAQRVREVSPADWGGVEAENLG
jgi:PhnB protein